jgi:hypothetical protein
MIYRILIELRFQDYDWTEGWRERDVDSETEWRENAVLGGVSGRSAPGPAVTGDGPGLADLMTEMGLPVSKGFSNRRAHFYFTERGWDEYGRRLAAAARERGLTVKIIKRKNPRPSQVVYRDEFQVAILPI